eukprot:4709921-Prymnesium_polylepis.1
MFRLPRIYRDTVCFVTRLALAYDVCALAVMVGNLFQARPLDYEGHPHAWITAILATALSLAVGTFVGELRWWHRPKRIPWHRPKRIPRA